MDYQLREGDMLATGRCMGLPGEAHGYPWQMVHHFMDVHPAEYGSVLIQSHVFFFEQLHLEGAGGA